MRAGLAWAVVAWALASPAALALDLGPGPLPSVPAPPAPPPAPDAPADGSALAAPSAPAPALVASAVPAAPSTGPPPDPLLRPGTLATAPWLDAGEGALAWWSGLPAWETTDALLEAETGCGQGSPRPLRFHRLADLTEDALALASEPAPCLFEPAAAPATPGLDDRPPFAGDEAGTAASPLLATTVPAEVARARGAMTLVRLGDAAPVPADAPEVRPQVAAPPREPPRLWWLWLAAGAAALALVPALRALAALFHRERGAGVLAHPARRRLVEICRARPGLSGTQLAAAAALSRKAAAYHLRRLAAEGFVRPVRSGRAVRYVAAAGPVPQAAVGLQAALDAPTARRVLDAVRAQGQASVRSVARALDQSPAVVHYHVVQLERAGALVRGPFQRGKPRLLQPAEGVSGIAEAKGMAPGAHASSVTRCASPTRSPRSCC